MIKIYKYQRKKNEQKPHILNVLEKIDASVRKHFTVKASDGKEKIMINRVVFCVDGLEKLEL